MREHVWLNPFEYPFLPHFLDLPAGRLHFVDEGAGPPVLMVHGTPTWSFLYRRLVKALRNQYRCVAPDHLGFGFSDKPAGWSYLPADHAGNLEALIEALQLRDLALVVHDFGGPIGLAYALKHPENVRQLVIMNTFMWSLQGDPHFERAGKLLGGSLGRFLYRNFAFSPRFMLPAAWGDRQTLTPELRQHYLQPLPTTAAREGTWVLARELLGSQAWYESLWQQRERIQDIPALIIWGMRDTAFRPQELARWQELFPSARVVRCETAGHFVPEEAPDVVAEEIEKFLA